MSNELKCIVILSTKSSGSSALQNLLASSGDIRHVAATRHRQNETLYWTKAASVLGLPQVAMVDSEVPIPRDKARDNLITLLKENVPEFPIPDSDEELIFQGWHALTQRFSPIFLEKSPHHLVQWSAIELLLACGERFPDIQFHFVGLVRNPLDVIYSVWQRWRSVPEQFQYEWFTAYSNLLRLKDVLGDRLTIVRYEDMVRSMDTLAPVFHFMELPRARWPEPRLHTRSLAKWQADKSFGFQLDRRVAELARQLGYDTAELQNRSTLMWPLYRLAYRSARQLIRYSKRLAPAALRP